MRGEIAQVAQRSPTNESLAVGAGSDALAGTTRVPDYAENAPQYRHHTGRWTRRELRPGSTPGVVHDPVRLAGGTIRPKITKRTHWP
jgi:hypothetical protein